MSDAVEPNEDNFEAAFAKLADLDAAGAEPPKEEPKAAEPAAAQQPAEAPAEEPAAEEAPAEEPAAEEAPPEKSADADTDTILERLARLVKETPQAEPEPPQQSAPAPQEAPIFTKDEQEFLTSYEKDWPDVAKAEALRRRAEYRELVGYVFTEVAKELRPVVELVQTMSQRTHLDDLKTTVNDYDDVRDKVISWVGQQPTYLQMAYKHVIEQGTVDEVADLIDRYRRETGVTAAPKPAASPATRKTESELPTATKQAAAALAPVSSKRSAVLQASDPDDFESAFAAFASKL